jgi:hypothetical protein
MVFAARAGLPRYGSPGALRAHGSFRSGASRREIVSGRKAALE